VELDITARPADGFGEIIANYDLWREITRLAGKQPYDPADWEDGRLYLRIDYVDKLREWPKWKQDGNWAAWIIEPTSEGYYNVLQSLRHERAFKRTEDVQVVFSQVADAGKYIILQLGDSLRAHLKMETLFVAWDSAGLDSRITITMPPEQAVDYVLKISPGTDRDFAVKYLKQYTFRDNPSSYGLAFPSEETCMQVLVLSFQQLNAALLDGMPQEITSQVAGLADRLGVRYS
jgi:hypothetical protein